LSDIIPLYPIPEPLSGDVFLCSYPKSGRTWVRQFLAQYMSLVYDLGYTEKYDLTKLLGIVPAEWMMVLHPVPFKYQGRIPRVRCSHFLPDGRVKGQRIIWLTRGAEDTLVSYYYHRQRVEQISEFVRSRVHELVFYYNEWDEALWDQDYLPITYEQLLGNPKWWFRAIIMFVGLEWDERHFATALERASFQNMRRDQAGSGDERIRKGVVGGYKAELAQEDIEYIRGIVKRVGPVWM
jgi:hypothetical protein